MHISSTRQTISSVIFGCTLPLVVEGGDDLATGRTRLTCFHIRLAVHRRQLNLLAVQVVRLFPLIAPRSIVRRNLLLEGNRTGARRIVGTC